MRTTPTAFFIVQCPSNGRYLHTADSNAKRDANFQGFGRFLTGSSGEYYFRTVKPVPYPGRTPHIHVKILHDGREVLTTQIYRANFPQNRSDFLFTRLSPDLYWGGEQASWWGPMAIAVIAGLTFATFLTLVLVPVMYSLLDDLEQAIVRLFRAKAAPTTPDLEPATGGGIAAD